MSQYAKLLLMLLRNCGTLLTIVIQCNINAKIIFHRFFFQVIIKFWKSKKYVFYSLLETFKVDVIFVVFKKLSYTGLNASLTSVKEGCLVWLAYFKFDRKDHCPNFFLYLYGHKCPAPTNHSTVICDCKRPALGNRSKLIIGKNCLRHLYACKKLSVLTLSTRRTQLSIFTIMKSCAKKKRNMINNWVELSSQHLKYF